MEQYLHKYTSQKSGYNLLVLGAIHGNEPCGTDAILEVIQENNLNLKTGSVTFIPCCNPKAAQLGTRFVDRDLNRYLYPREQYNCYEDSLVNLICEQLASADFVLDIHSYQSKGQPFIFLGPDNHPAEINFAQSLGINNYIFGWQAAFAKQNQEPTKSQGTTEYTRLQGRHAVTLECGNHNDPNAKQVAKQAIYNALESLKIVDKKVNIHKTNNPQMSNYIKMQHVYKYNPQDSLIKQWHHLDFIAKGEKITNNIQALEDCYMVLPKYQPVENEDWFYLGIKSSYH